MSTKFVLNPDGVSQMLKSPEVQKALSEKAEAIRDRCGDGYVTHDNIGSKRARSTVVADTFKARYDNSKNNTLLTNLR